jgi:hypothetical protein
MKMVFIRHSLIIFGIVVSNQTAVQATHICTGHSSSWSDVLNIRGVSKKFGEWYQKTNKTEDTNKLSLLAFKIIAILYNTLLATLIKLLQTVSKGLFRIVRSTAVTRSWIVATSAKRAPFMMLFRRGVCASVVNFQSFISNLIHVILS